jgi:acetyl esterase/lipase
MSNPQIDAIRKNLAENPVVPEGATLEEMREGIDSMGEALPAPPDVTAAAVDAGGVPSDWVTTPDADGNRAVLYLHGGGYVIGSPKSHRGLMGRLSKATGARVLGIAYRMAPEDPFPAAVEDSVKAYRWLLDQGIEAVRISIAGDSAGGGLAAATLVAIRNEGLPQPGCAVFVSPWIDMEGKGESMETRAAVDPMVQRDMLLEMAKTYLGDADPRSPLASPLHADLSGLAPIYIQVGDAETLLSDSVRLEAALKDAGNDVTLEVWDEMIHVWHLFAPILDKGQEAIDRMGEFIRKHA